jgi:elongation factor Ts
MAEITATLVNELRSKTGQPMMACKKVLTEAKGDIAKAVDIFRKMGVKDSVTARITSEGRVFGALSPDGRLGAIVNINANTDFTAKSDLIKNLGQDALKVLLANPKADAATDPTIKEKVTQAAQTTGENVHLGKTAVAAAPEGGKVGLYNYAITGKIGVLMVFSSAPSDELVSDIGGHIAFAKPLALDRSGISTDLIAKEKEIAVEQAKATGKPQQIAEKIAEGKLNAFFKEKTLLDQDFFNAGKFKGSVADYLKQNKLSLLSYTRIELGQ